MIKLTQAELNELNRKNVNFFFNTGFKKDRVITNLVNFDLRNLSLEYFRFAGIQFYNCDIRGSHLPSPTEILAAGFYGLTNELTAELMLYDAVNHPNGRKAFNIWDKTGSCPFHETHFKRAAIFTQNSRHWKLVKGRKYSLSAYELVIRIFKEKNILFKEI